MTGFSYGNGVAASFGYSAERLQLTSLSYTKDATKLLELAYSYTQNGGNNGQITGITDSTGTEEAGRSVSYTYDALHRLKTAVTQGSTTYPKWDYEYRYDRYGNRTAQDLQPGSVGPHPEVFLSYEAASNRISDTGYNYDDSGNLTQDGTGAGTHSYEYDAENRVTQVDNGATASYTYDGVGLRVKKEAGSTTTRYIFSGTKVIAEYVNGAAVGSPTREYIYAGSGLLATIEGGSTTYHQSDHLSVRLTTKGDPATPPAQIIEAEQGHYPFGESWYPRPNSAQWQFTSYERDGESGLDYAIFRYDASRLGRFMTPDPIAGSIADPQSLNRYPYVGNDPVNFVDPLGLLREEGPCADDPDCTCIRQLVEDRWVEVERHCPERTVVPRGWLCRLFGLFCPSEPRFPPDPGGPGGGNQEPDEKECEGESRVLGGNPRLIGKRSGFDTEPTSGIRVTKNSVAVDPAQWGGKAALRPYLDEITGVIHDPEGDVPFTGVSDVIGSDEIPDGYSDIREFLRAKNPGKLLLELVSGKDMGIQRVTIKVPKDKPCPEGTTEKK